MMSFRHWREAIEQMPTARRPLYVATATDYYRRLIDGKMSANDRPQHEADMQTVFSRPWTRLFVSSHLDKEVADRDTVGHRGALIGQVESVTSRGRSRHRLQFRTARPLERHDGLQIDLPVLGKPFGFAVDRLWLVEKERTQRREVIELLGADGEQDAISQRRQQRSGRGEGIDLSRPRGRNPVRTIVTDIGDA